MEQKQNESGISFIAVRFEEVKPGDDDSPLIIIFETHESKQLYLGCNVTKGTVVASVSFSYFFFHYDTLLDRLSQRK